MATQLVTSFRRTPFVGREPELADMTQLVDEAASGRGGLVLIGGEAGIGKSRLSEELARRASARGLRAVFGHSYEGAGSAPYAPFAEALEPAVRGLPEEERRALTTRFGPRLGRLLPSLSRKGEARSRPTEDERLLLFGDVQDLLREMSERTPVVVVLDDLHWADSSTVLLLRHLARTLENERQLIIGTYRDADIDALEGGDSPLDGLLEDLRRLPRSHMLSLKPLPEEYVGAMVRSITGHDSPDRVTHAVFQQTEGNPFFVEEVVSHLLEEGRLLTPDGKWRADAALEPSLPEGVRRVVGRRLQRISAGSRGALTVAAVIGRTFSYELLKAVAGVPEGELLDALDEAERARLVMSERGVHDTRLSFAHELTRQALLTQISRPRQQQLHLAIVQAIEARGYTEAHVSDLARHSLLAGPAADAEKTIGYLEAAGQRANQTTAYEEAAHLYREALRLLPPGDDRRRCELTLRLGESQKRVSDSPEARDLFVQAAALARGLGDAALMCRAALGVTRSWPTVGLVDEPAVAILREALANEDAPVSMRADLTARLALQLYYSPGPDEVKSLAAQAVELARESGEPVTLARALQTRHVAIWEPPHLEERLKIAREIIDVSRGSGVRLLALWGQRPLIADLMEAGETEAAEKETEAYVALTAEIRMPLYIWQSSVRRAMLAIYRGRLAEGEKLAGETLALGQRAGGQNLLAAYGLQMLFIRWLQGRLGEMEPLARASLARQPEMGLWKAVLAFVLADSGSAGEAREQLNALAANNFAALPKDDTRPIAVTLAAIACAAMGDAAKAHDLHRELEWSDGRNIVLSEGVVCAGPASYYLGLLAATAGDPEAAELHFIDAMDLAREAGGRPWLALAALAYAEVLFARRGSGDRKHALEHVADAVTCARELGMAGIQGKAERLLASHKGAAQAFPDGLTRREVEVLRLLASGASNKEISETLVLSLRTTARHITNIYGKIAARNRAEATSYAIRHELLSG